MKILLCKNVQLGSVCTENLDTKLSHKWKAARIEKLSELIDKAAQNNASYVFLCGRIFGQERVSEMVIDHLFHAVKENLHIQVMAFLIVEEYNRISYRNDIPENLHLICVQTTDTYNDNCIAVRIDHGNAEILLSDNNPIWIKYTKEHGYILTDNEDERRIPSFEPIGFEDAEDSKVGYGLLEWSEDNNKSYTEFHYQKYAYASEVLKILPEDGQKDIIRKINNIVTNYDPDTFLRITIVGKSAFGLTLNSDALKNQLQNKIFFVEVYDNTIMDIDEEVFENDISLRSEFVRLALQDDSLSELERNRLISCGWNALNGKEVSAE